MSFSLQSAVVIAHQLILESVDVMLSIEYECAIFAERGLARAAEYHSEAPRIDLHGLGEFRVM